MTNLPDKTKLLPLLLGMVMLRANHAFQLTKQNFGYAQPLRDVEQQPLLGGIKPAVGISGLQLDLDEHLDEGTASMAFPAELIQHIVEREVFLFTLVEQSNSGTAHLGIEFHLLHHRFRQGDLGL